LIEKLRDVWELLEKTSRLLETCWSTLHPRDGSSTIEDFQLVAPGDAWELLAGAFKTIRAHHTRLQSTQGAYHMDIPRPTIEVYHAQDYSDLWAMVQDDMDCKASQD
jgi:hypothetical protein